MPKTPETLLCVANFQSNTGYAWDFIEGFYARIADHIAGHGIRTIVAYPAIASEPRTLAGSAAEAVVLDASLNTPGSLQKTVALVCRENVRVVYFVDLDPCRWQYRRLRRAGIRRIIVHDHTSGERTRPRGAKRVAKWLFARTPGVVADVVIGVSGYVARRQKEINLIPPKRVVKVWNALPLIPLDPNAGTRAQKILGLEEDRPLIASACRATPEKGIAHLLRAFDFVVSDALPRRPVLAYLGDGPQFPELQAIRDGLSCKEDIILPGYSPASAEILAGADICVVPSVWQEAFCLVVLEAMIRARPVIATRAGAIPELIEDGASGLLVPPGDEAALADAIRSLLLNPERAARLGDAGRKRAAELFDPIEQVHALTELVEEGFGEPCDEVAGSNRACEAP